MAGDALPLHELDMVFGYMSNRMHPGVQSKGSADKSLREDPVLLRGSFTRNEFVASVLKDWADHNKPPTWGDLYRPTRPNHQPQPEAVGRQNVQEGVMIGESNCCKMWVLWSGTPESRHAEVSWVVNVVKGAKSLVDHPKYKAKIEKILKIYGDVLNGKP